MGMPLAIEHHFIRAAAQSPATVRGGADGHPIGTLCIVRVGEALIASQGEQVGGVHGRCRQGEAARVVFRSLALCSRHRFHLDGVLPVGLGFVVIVNLLVFVIEDADGVIAILAHLKGLLSQRRCPVRNGDALLDVPKRLVGRKIRHVRGRNAGFGRGAVPQALRRDLQRLARSFRQHQSVVGRSGKRAKIERIASHVLAFRAAYCAREREAVDLAARDEAALVRARAARAVPGAIPGGGRAPLGIRLVGVRRVDGAVHLARAEHLHVHRLRRNAERERAAAGVVAGAVHRHLRRVRAGVRVVGVGQRVVGTRHKLHARGVGVGIGAGVACRNTRRLRLAVVRQAVGAVHLNGNRLRAVLAVALRQILRQNDELRLAVGARVVSDAAHCNGVAARVGQVRGAGREGQRVAAVLLVRHAEVARLHDGGDAAFGAHLDAWLERRTRVRDGSVRARERDVQVAAGTRHLEHVLALAPVVVRLHHARRGT